MIDRKGLEEYAKIRGLNLGQAEKDYVQTFILYQRYGRELVFKGDTALNKCYNLDRFSQDIDFTSAVNDNFSKTISSGLEKFLIYALMKTLGRNYFL